MSTLWTPGGERPIRREPEPERTPPSATAATAATAAGAETAGAETPGGTAGAETLGGTAGPGELSDAEIAAQMAELRDRLADTPAEVVVANHAYGLFELAALHLSLDPPKLDQARLAIDALGYVVEGLGPRLGPHSEELTAGLAQLRMAYVRLQGVAGGGHGAPG